MSQFIKECASLKGNWIDSDKLVLRLAFGARRKDDEILDLGDLKADGILDEVEISYSQQPKDEPKDKYNGTKRSMAKKDKPRLTETFLLRLFNDSESQLKFGFTHEMKGVMKNAVLFDKGNFFEELVNSGEFPPNEENVRKLVEDILGRKQFCGLVPTAGMFPPVGANSNLPPTMKKWKYTKNGKDHFNSTGGNARRVSLSHEDSSDDETPSRTISSSVSSSGRNNKKKVGQVNIDTGLYVTKLKYHVSESDGEFNLNSTLIDLVKKGKRWKHYTPTKEERIFHVLKPDGSIFSSYLKNKLKLFTLGEQLQMMSLSAGGEPICIKSDIQTKKNMRLGKLTSFPFKQMKK